MRTLPPKTTLLILTAIPALLAQGLAFAPTRFQYILQILPPWGNLTYGIALFILTTLSFAYIVHRHFDSRTNWTLLAIQGLTVVGIFFLQGGFDSHAAEAAFLLTGAVTALTMFGILSGDAPAPAIAAPMKPIEAVEIAGPEEPKAYSESNSRVLGEQIELVSRKLTAEKYRTTQLTFLNELSQQLESELDPPVAAQLAVNMLDRALDCSLVSLMLHEPERREFVSLAASGKMANLIPPGYRQNSEQGLLGRVARLKKTQLVNDTSVDPDFIRLDNEHTASAIAVPMMHNGQIKGVIEVCSEKVYEFSNADVNIVEGVALELTLAWERSSYNQRLTELIQAGISLTTVFNPQAAVEEIALLARKTLEARFVFITLLDQQGNFSRTAYAGDAPKLLNCNYYCSSKCHRNK